jgi:endonuclease YncB( thermonuclease family)
VLHVVNGDTVTARIGNQEKKVRLYGITAPRLTQPHGLATQGYLETLVLNRAISVDPVETDRYGRTIGIVALRDGRTLQEKLLAEGYAWLSPKYCTRQECSRWKELEAEARAARRGLWQDENPVPPWQWKGKHPATAQAPVQDAAAQHTSGDAPSASLVKPIQTGLRSLDFDPGAADGKLTERTRQAIRKFQEAKGLKADGMPSQDVLNEIIGALMERIQNESQGETDKDVLKRLHQYDAMIKEIMG